MHIKLLPFKYKILGEILILIGLIALLILAFAFPMDAPTSALQSVMTLFIVLCYAGIGTIIFSKERIETPAVMQLRLKAIAIMALLGFAAFIILDIYKVWVPASDWKVYLSVIHAVPFIYYLIFRILYRKIK